MVQFKEPADASFEASAGSLLCGLSSDLQWMLNRKLFFCDEGALHRQWLNRLFVELVFRRMAMRFMMLVIPKGYESAPPDAMPDAKAVAAMMDYNRALQQAGVLLALEGLLPPAVGARVSFSQGKPQVRDGPFPEVKEVVGGFWIIEVNSRDEAIEWAKRCPMMNDEVIEIRQVQEMEDFPPDVQKAAAGFEAMRTSRTEPWHGNPNIHK